MIPDDAWQKLVWLIHVPLDKHVLLGLRACVRYFPNKASIGVVPENPSMNFIKSQEAYTAFHEGIRALADKPEPHQLRSTTSPGTLSIEREDAVLPGIELIEECTAGSVKLPFQWDLQAESEE